MKRDRLIRRVSLAGLLLSAGLLLAYVTGTAAGDNGPPVTVTTPTVSTPNPLPAPAPAPQPAPKPAPKPAPVHTPQPSSHSSQTPAPAPTPARSAPTVRTTPAVAPPVAHVKAAQVVKQRAAKAPRPKTTTTPPVKHVVQPPAAKAKPKPSGPTHVAVPAQSRTPVVASHLPLYIFAAVILSLLAAMLLRSPRTRLRAAAAGARRGESKPREVIAELVDAPVLAPTTTASVASAVVAAPPPPREVVSVPEQEPVEADTADIAVPAVAAAAATAAAADPEAGTMEPLAPAEPTEESCEIAFWRGYTKSRFFARLDVYDEYGEIAVAESPAFRSSGNGVPDRTEAAEEAHDDLIRQLLADGWLLEDGAEPWYANRLWRPVAEGEHALG